MRNEKLRHAKRERNKKRREKRQVSCKKETYGERKIRVKSFAKAGSIHGSRKIRKKLRKMLSIQREKIQNIFSKTIHEKVDASI